MKEYIVQISTGDYAAANIRFEQIRNKLAPLLKQIPLRAVIMGWSGQKELYQQTKQLLAPYQTELYLWLPVFSENNRLKKVPDLIDYQNKAVSHYHLNQGENFEFCCPNRRESIERFLEIYEEHFAGLAGAHVFDGVFLDRIRYASFSNGRSGVFSCFCPVCREKYQARGLDISTLTTQMQLLSTGQDGYDRIPFKMEKYQSGTYQFADPIWSAFFKAKQDFIYEALKPVSQYFKAKGLRVGLDLFSPFMAYFVGQDPFRLSLLADFVKPMMYRATYAPAGIPFELDRLIKETVPRTQRQTAGDEYRRIIGAQATGLNAAPLTNISFVKTELEILKQPGAFTATDIGAATKTRIYCGIEVNYLKDVVPTTAEYVAANLNELAQTDIDGFVLSWDLLSAPESHLRAVTAHIGKTWEG